MGRGHQITRPDAVTSATTTTIIIDKKYNKHTIGMRTIIMTGIMINTSRAAYSSIPSALSRLLISSSRFFASIFARFWIFH